MLAQIAMLLDTVMFTPVTNTYNAASGNETVPVGATSLTVEVWGAGGSGSKKGTTNESFGGGGGAYQKTIIAIRAADWKKTLAYVAGTGPAGFSANSDGTLGPSSTATINGLVLAPTNLSAAGGAGGTATAGTGGAAGAAGNTTNTAGGNALGKANNFQGGTGANGGAGGTASGTLAGTVPGGGGAGMNGSTGTNSGAGANGQVRFAWT